MKAVLESIQTFNEKAGLLTGYNEAREASYLIEEALEGFDLTLLKSKLFPHDTEAQVTSYTAKDCGRQIARLATLKPFSMTSVDKVDKACDAIVFAVGSMFKLGLTVEQVVQALTIVTEANLTKLGGTIDSAGKLTKPEAFIPPEEQLLALLGPECSCS